MDDIDKVEIENDEPQDISDSETSKQTKTGKTKGEKRGARKNFQNFVDGGKRFLNNMKGNKEQQTRTSNFQEQQSFIRKESKRNSLTKKRAKARRAKDKRKKDSKTLNSPNLGQVERAALVILNADYSSCPDYGDLLGVKDDGDKMQEILSDPEFVVEVKHDVADIGAVVQEFSKKYKEAGTLVFHYSGHGLDNIKLPLETKEDKTGKHFETSAPYGDCMVGSGGDLYSVHDLKHELVANNPGKVFVTLDCCRNQDQRGASNHSLKLRHKKKMSESDQEKFAVLYGTSELHTASDSYTLTQELYKIYPLPIREIPGKVNKSWKEQGHKPRQVCKLDIVEVGENWVNIMWPASNMIVAKRETQQDSDTEPKDEGEQAKLDPSIYETINQVQTQTQQMQTQTQQMQTQTQQMQTQTQQMQTQLEKATEKTTELQEGMKLLKVEVDQLKDKNTKLEKENAVLSEVENETAKRRRKMANARQSRDVTM